MPISKQRGELGCALNFMMLKVAFINGLLPKDSYGDYVAMCKYFSIKPPSEKTYYRWVSELKAIKLINSSGRLVSYDKFWSRYGVQDNKTVKINVSKDCSDLKNVATIVESRNNVISQINAILAKQDEKTRILIRSNGKGYKDMFLTILSMSSMIGEEVQVLSNYFNQLEKDEKHINLDVSISLSSAQKFTGYKTKSGVKSRFDKIGNKISIIKRKPVKLKGVFIDPIYVESGNIVDGLVSMFGNKSTQFRACKKTGQVSVHRSSIINPF